MIPLEILAETVFVLNRVYDTDRNEISKNLVNFIEQKNIIVTNEEFVKYSLSKYRHSNLHIIDCFICAYKKYNDQEVFTFDKKLKKHLSNI